MESDRFCNQKRGCAKTVSSISLGVGLAREGRRVLPVDVDSQGSMPAGFWEIKDNNLVPVQVDRWSSVMYPMRKSHG